MQDASATLSPADLARQKKSALDASFFKKGIMIGSLKG